jgi:hypothetical protein
MALIIPVLHFIADSPLGLLKRTTIMEIDFLCFKGLEEARGQVVVIVIPATTHADPDPVCRKKSGLAFAGPVFSGPSDNLLRVP